MDNIGSIKVEQHCSEASVQKYEEEWHQLFNNHNIEKLRKYALFGHLRASRFRSLCWFLLLDTLPQDSSKWLNEISKLRKSYKKIKDNLSCDPWNNKTDVDDPLSQNDNSIWNRHFCDEELRSVIKQDVVRTFPGVDFFRKPVIQEIMVSILFSYAREHPIMCYRQGMHELLAPLLFVLHCDHQAMLHTDEQTNLDDVVKNILNPDYLEEDGYNLFVALMSSMSCCYHINNVAPTATGYFPGSSVSSESPGDSKESENEVVLQLNSIRDNLLQKVDPELCEHLKNLDITLPLFGIRWLRLLFGREFALQDLLVLWDAIFSRGQDFKFVHCVVVAMLYAIRKQLLEGDYTGCLMYLMRYPIHVDISYVIRYALHLQNPKEFPNPPVKSETMHLTNIPKKNIQKQPEVYINKMNFISVKQSVSGRKNFNKFTNKFVPQWDSTETNIVGNETSERLLAELKHAHSIMSLSRLKLLQYHHILVKAIPNSENTRDAMLALDGIHELCNLLTSRYYSPQTPSEVEHAIEAGEVRPTELNLNLNVSSQPAGRSMERDKEMKIFAKTEVVQLDGVPMTDPTHRM